MLQLVMPFTVFLFETRRGEKPVEKFIKTLSSPTLSKVLRSYDLLKKYGNLLSFPHSKKVGNNLFELRIRGKQEIRIFYTFRRDSIYLLHGFIKKSQKTLEKEMATAFSRAKLI